MALSGVMRVQKGADQLTEMVAPEAREISSVDGPDREREQAFHALNIVVERRVLGVGHQRSVVDDIARERYAGRRFPQRDRPW